MTFPTITPVVSLILIPLLLAPPGWSQAAVAPAPVQPGSLQLKLVESDGPQIATNSRGSKGFSFQVTDANGTGIADAAVALRLPDSGASGLFADGSHSGVIYSDASGRAHVDGILWNAVPGQVMVRVTATKGDAHAGMLVEQTLVSGAGANLSAPRLEAAAPRAPQATTAEDAAPLNTIAADAVSVRPAVRATLPASEVPFLRSASPSVSISNDGSGPAYHGSYGNKKKWILIGLAIAAGAGAAFAASTLAKGGSTAASSSSISIGAPTVSVGHP